MSKFPFRRNGEGSTVWGMGLLTNTSQEPVTLTEARIVTASRDVEVVDSWVWDEARSQTSRAGTLSAWHGALPQEWLDTPRHEIAGFEARPLDDRGFQIAFELHFPPEGGSVQGIEVSYIEAGIPRVVLLDHERVGALSIGFSLWNATSDPPIDLATMLVLTGWSVVAVLWRGRIVLSLLRRPAPQTPSSQAAG